MDNGFVDLRQNHGHSGFDQNFWPSFTDIMTVIVMIFMITTTVLMVKHWGMVSEMRATLEAERQARAEAAAVRETSRSLEAQLTDLESALSEARLRIMQMEEENRRQAEQMLSQQQQLLGLGTEREQLMGALSSAQREAAQLGGRAQEAEALSQRLEQAQREQAQQLESTLQSLAQLEQSYQRTLGELGRTRQEAAAATERLSSLSSEYTSLEEKYQKLLRPARSAEGKEVAEVRFRRAGDGRQIELRLPGEETFRTMGEDDLNRRLSALKQKYGKDLYVKIVIPPDSGLSYNEAWDFTRTILNRYDYYYQQ